ncbi:MAG TPA: UDP-N-acetylmuramoyl-L-alanyl-D-glutamate--2,6-diaminopimelate ligase [Patescibacteria group bacterium]|nr:UDP-N-acetylmuramoyl-L-alanyl-D-glutamate--2,6-diaminopimelate ligase [Patescibacteria group bacterium]
MGLRSIVKKVVPRGALRKIKPAGHYAEAVLLNARYGFPSKGLKVIGVTGTNGKTTTCFLIHKMLVDAGYKVGLITTVAYGVGDDIKPQLTHMTTPTVPVLLNRIKKMRAQGVEWLVLETTSHALDQHRVWGIPYIMAVFTNLTHEHISYHGSFEHYRAAKRKLFEMTNRNRAGLRLGIVNADDRWANVFASAVKKSLSYGIKDGDARAKDIKLGASGVKYSVTLGGTTYHISCRLPGTFNVYNSLAAVCVGHALGLSQKQVEQGIAALEGVEGRMTRIDEGQPFDVIVDYAHTPDSFEQLFADIKPVVKGKLIVLFGSLGGGDKGKRPLQGELAGRFANELIICEEDDRAEDPAVIMGDIAKGARKAGKVDDKDLFLIHDRTKAMQFAVSRAKKGDVVLFLGKGHEKTIEHNDGTQPWDEIATARSVLAKRTR